MGDTVDKLNEFFKGKDKKLVANLSVAFVAGIVLILSSGILSGNNGKNTNSGTKEEVNPAQNNSLTGQSSYERDLEKRLEETLGMVSGAGEVKVMLTLSNGREIVVAENTEYNKKSTKEADNDGGTREIEELQTNNEAIIISKKSGENEPLILKEIEPKVEGVILIAKGADDIIVKDALIRAAHAVLGVEIHKIQVLKMK